MRLPAAIPALVVLVLVLATGGYAARGVGGPAQPLTYTFQVASVAVDATFSKSEATASTALHLVARPGPKSLSWRGIGSSAAASTPLRLVGTATYTGLDAGCNGTFRIRSRPVIVSLRVVNAAKLSASTGSFPLATIYPAADGSCENGAVTWRERGFANLPLDIVRRAAFSFTARYSKTLEDGTAVQWTVAMRVRRVR